MAKSVDEIVLHIEKDFLRWTTRQETIVNPLVFEDLGAWLSGHDDSNELSAGGDLRVLSLYGLKRFILQNRGVTPDMAEIARVTRYALPEFLFAIGVQKRNTNSGLLMKDYVASLMMATTLGWRDHAELHARLGLQELMKHSIRRGDVPGGALGQGIAPHGYIFVIMDVFRDHLRAVNTSTSTPWREELYESFSGGYGGWAEIAAHWREPDPAKFAEILYRAADYHVAQSHDMVTKGLKHDPDRREIHFEIERDAWWLYPVILFTFLRLREWEGLPNPGYLAHDLFPEGRVQPPAAGARPACRRSARPRRSEVPRRKPRDPGPCRPAAPARRAGGVRRENAR